MTFLTPIAIILTLAVLGLTWFSGGLAKHEREEMEQFHDWPWESGRW